ncbi:MAG: transcription termination factor Rho [Acidobacteriota bacterium]|nr:transcription termination factor Rho [Acidobacteriota bacterium]
MSEPQLERSVLEAKERDELMAIATALGASPGARAKKADLITAILKATGIEVDGAAGAEAAEETPAPRRRTRARRTAETSEEPESTDAAQDTGAAESDGAAGSEPDRVDRSSPAPAPAPGPGRPRAGSARSAVQAVQLDLGTDDDDSSDGDDSAPEDEDAEPRDTPARPTREERSATVPPGRGPRRAEGREAGGGNASERYIPERNGVDAGRPVEAARAPDGANSRTAGAPAPTEHRSQDHGGGDDFQGRPGDNGDSGNRRSRRRRGRDRFERGERDLPGQAPEQQFSGEPIPVDGYLDLREEGYGFLRTSGFLSGPGDVYVSISQVRRFALRRGDRIEGAARPAGGNEKYPALLRIDKVSGLTPDEARNRPRFEALTPLFPDTRLKLELPSHPANDTARIVDLLSPIGKGQRGLIVSPPKAGKTTVLKQIAHCIEVNNPEVQLMVLLVDERPEEVTDMARSVKGEVIASTFDRPAEEHIQVAELTIERAKRMVELGKDVVIILDGITRLARAYNLGAPATGRIMSGGIDTGALYPPKKFFGAARNIEEGGSLTILATALVETGSRMDEVIFEEFKGTGNMELRLDRKLAERRIYPAIDVNGSSTRHEELLFNKSQLQQVWKLRRVLNALGAEGSAAAGLELLLERLKSTKNNDEFLAEVAKTATPNI